MTSADREQLKRTFDRDAELYDQARPGYPEQIFDDLLAFACLGPEAIVLEVGCGTGQASQALAQRAYRLVCLELGNQLATVARRKLAPFPRVEVVTSAFESWESGGQVFDMVFAASSWHWLNPEVRYEKAARLLKPSGAARNSELWPHISRRFRPPSLQKFKAVTKGSVNHAWIGRPQDPIKSPTSGRK